MPANESDNLALQVAGLRADVRYLQADLANIKSELRETNQRIESVRTEAQERFDKVK